MSYATLSRKNEPAPPAKARAASKSPSHGLRLVEPDDASDREADCVADEAMTGGAMVRPH